MSAFATTDQVAARLGKDSLTSTETATATQLITSATGLIIDAVNRDEDWADALSPVPTVLESVCIEAVARVMLNPTGARSVDEQLGQHRRAEQFGDAQAGGLMLTEQEERRARRAVWGTNAGSFHAQGAVDTLRHMADGVFDGTSDPTDA